MPRAAARHILVKGEAECQNLIEKIKAGADFGTVAAEHSQCPSGQSGGALGEFGPGQMVPEFDQAVFSGDIGAIQGPIKTQFGYHVLEVTMRTD